jgi:Flp pilus assembly protein TadD
VTPLIAGGLLAACLWLPAPVSGQDSAATLDASLAQARAQVDAGQAKAAIAGLAALDTSDPRVRHMLGVAYYHSDDYPHAIEQLAPIMRQFPRESLEGREIVQVLGLSYYLAGRIPEAIPLLEATRQSRRSPRPGLRRGAGHCRRTPAGGADDGSPRVQ